MKELKTISVRIAVNVRLHSTMLVATKLLLLIVDQYNEDSEESQLSNPVITKHVRIFEIWTTGNMSFTKSY